MAGDLPPSSSVTGTRFAAAAFITARAVPAAPVNTRWSKGRALKAWATSTPPSTTAISVSSNAARTIAATTVDTVGVSSEGLIIARLPAARMPPSGLKVSATGAFHGAATPTTPSGW